jgi:hypothetical protein
MGVSRSTKVFIWTILGLFVFGVTWFAHGVYSAWHRFASEERFCAAFHPVTDGIAQFRESTGTLPTNLTQLVPAYLPRLPMPPVADLMEYQVMPGGTKWQLTIHSRITGPSRVFIQRSPYDFTDEERRRSVAGFHGWVVFRE